MAIQAYDFLLDDEFDFDWSSGDFEVIESSQEHLAAILDSVSNDYKQDPLIGVNLPSYVNGPLNSSVIDLKRIISDNMRRDGFKVTDLVVNGNLSLNQLNIQTSGERLR